MLDHFERAGNRRGRIAQREADPLFPMVNSQDSHRTPLLNHGHSRIQRKKNLRATVSPWLVFNLTMSPLKYEKERSASTATSWEKAQ